MLLAIAMAGCSTNAGFGTPSSGGLPGGYPNGGAASPMPAGSGNLPMGNGQQQPPSSPLPTATPLPNTLTIEGASLHLAYDAAAPDPVKAPRLLELAFALQNTTKKAEKITTIKLQSDKTAVGETTVAVNAPANQTSHAALVTVKVADNPGKYKQLKIDFVDEANKTISTQTLDVPQQDFAFNPLGEKHPKGGVTIDSVEVSRIEGATGLHYDCTFALTNAGTTPAAITGFTVAPPKGSSVTIPMTLSVPARTTSGFVSFVVPFSGKSLPTGTYTVSAMQNKTTVAKGVSSLL